MNNYIFREYDDDRIIIRNLYGSTHEFDRLTLDKFHLMMLDEGEMTVDVNRRIFNLKSQSTLHLHPGDKIRYLQIKKEVKGYHLIFSTEFQNEIRTSRKSPINLQLKKQYPYQEFNDDDYELLVGSIRRLKRYIADETHTYRSIVIKNVVHNLLLDISDRRRKDHGNHMEQATHKDVILERFKSLIVGHCNEHHNVSWYSDVMMITPDYLSKITRESLGKSARTMITERIISNAKFMMQQSNMSLKEISSRLNFPDQSSFGRFFKSFTGVSPKEFRNSLNQPSTV